MNLSVTTSLTETVFKLSYDVLIENQQDGTLKAILLGLPDCQGLGNTETEAIENRKIQSKFTNSVRNSQDCELMVFWLLATGRILKKFLICV